MTKSVVETRRQKGEKRRDQALDLQHRVDSIPGVADLVRLYANHAALVAKSQGYVRHQSRFTVVTSGDSTI